MSYILAVLAVIALIAGVALLLDWWKPFKKVTVDEKGEKKVEEVPLSPKEKMTAGGIILSLILSLLSLLFISDPPWLQKWREKANGRA